VSSTPDNGEFIIVFQQGASLHLSANETSNLNNNNIQKTQRREEFARRPGRRRQTVSVKQNKIHKTA
jgi:hypothetical protein